MNPDIDRDKRLTAEELRGQNLEAIWDFATTAELPSLTGIIGQARAAKAFEFGLQIKDKGYNIFVSGLSGTGKATYAKEMAAQLARQEATPSDWVYVHNFAHPHRPLALELPPGRGRELVKDMEEFLDEIRMGLPKIFNGEDYERRRTELLATYQEESQQIIHELEEYAKDRDFVLKRTGNGFITLPAPKGKILESEEYAALETEEKRELESRGKEVQTRLSDALRQIRNLEKEAREKVEQLEREVTLSALGP
ncbi:MAG: Lon-like protease helical domain-containing protein, partial [Limnochordia bacterium]